MSGEKEPETFADRDLRGARFVRSDLTGAVMRGVDVAGLDIDSPWLLDEDGALFVNDGYDTRVFSSRTPTYDDVLAARNDS